MRATAVRRARIDAYDADRPLAAYDLTERGRTQSRLLGARLARADPPAVIYTGESDRHRATATGVAGTIEAVTDDRPALEVEADLNDLAWTREALETCQSEGLSQAEWHHRWLDGALTIDETAEEARHRLRALSDRLAGRHDQAEHVLLVTSAMPVLLLLCEAMGSAIEETDLSVANAAVNILEWTGPEREVSTINDTAHLPGGLVTVDGFVGRE